mmetsp:Transcript_38655/g.86918  ORF Transcript_38655/g.86918 Transcript_38655/m.86918 type:complete len:86 (+) Transcript_38655:576-833(+)
MWRASEHSSLSGQQLHTAWVAGKLELVHSSFVEHSLQLGQEPHSSLPVQLHNSQLGEAHSSSEEQQHTSLREQVLHSSSAELLHS